MAATTDPTGPAHDRAALAGAAASVGASDVFVFRRVTPERFVHVGGLGHGESWAGNVDLVPGEDARAGEAIATGRIVTASADEPVQIFGPYYHRSAVFVPLPSADVLVVLGGIDVRERLDAQTAAALQRAAEQAAAAVAQISPAKRLADELELLHAVRSLAQSSAVHIDEVMKHVAESAIEALSCDLGLIYVAEVDTVEIAEREPSGTDPHVFLQAARRLYAEADTLPACVQDSASEPPPAPLDGCDATAHYVLPIGQPIIGVLVLVHTKARPRGFTHLCREVGIRLAEAAEPLLRSALKLHGLERQLDLVGRDARIDPLTKLPNRRAWEEALAGVAGEHAGIVVIDVDQLKTINDERGHHVGDEFLQAVAVTMGSAIRSGDLLARVGGDEFAILLPDADENACRRVARRLNRALLDHEGFAGYPLAASVGYAATPPAPSLEEAWRVADEAMYRGKPGTELGRRPAA
ncbi:MAG: diguanylate cyclase domain-containing protein [Verrucomicrobiota bacterium]